MHSAYKEVHVIRWQASDAGMYLLYSAPVGTHACIRIMSSVSSSIAYTLHMCLSSQHGPWVQVPFAYHDGYLSVHFEVNKYQDIKLTPLQEEAVL